MSWFGFGEEEVEEDPNAKKLIVERKWDPFQGLVWGLNGRP
jgi:hypothetical protein